MPTSRLPGVVPAARARLAALLLLALAAACDPPEQPPVSRDRAVLLIGNTRADNIVTIDEQTGQLLGEFIPAGRGNLKAPDALVFGPDGHLYVTSGDTRANSAVLRFHGKTGEFLGTFSSGNGLFRPYGLAFGPDNYLYVSSFLSDQILRFSAQTGTFVDVFAQGNGQPGGLNGPNALAFGPDGALYVSTQGSIAVDGQPTFPGLPSQVLRFNIISRQSEVFADQPTPPADGAGFISLLGLAFGPDCNRPGGDCDLFVSDFANDIRRYDRTTRALEATLSTRYLGTPPRNFLGSLAFGEQARLYTVGFDNSQGANFRGAVLRFDGRANQPLPASGQSGALFVPPDDRLVRPIGIAFTRLPQQP